eukprot:jgi/Psemu1/193922/e_gw1.149.25.1
MPSRRPPRREPSDEQTKNSGTRRPKRPRTAASQPLPQEEEEERPDPPPPAPPALIRLLGKDKKVLDYFRALQLNLSYDVEKWKKRSKSHQDQLEELRQKHRAVEQSKSNDRSEQLRSTHDNKHDGENESNENPSGFNLEFSSSDDDSTDPRQRDDRHRTRDTNRNKKKPATLSDNEAGNKPSFQFHFDRESDDDDDSDENSRGGGGGGDDDKKPTSRASKSTNYNRNHRPSNHPRSTVPLADDRVPNRIRVGWNLLRKAHDCLNKIGIRLASAVILEDRTGGIDDGDGDGEQSDPEERSLGEIHDAEHGEHDTAPSDGRTNVSYIRRSDHAVLADILQTIKEWTRLTATDANGKSRNDFRHYAAYNVLELTPCFVPVPNLGAVGLETVVGTPGVSSGGAEDQPSLRRRCTLPQHPAVEGVDRLVEALTCIDAFGSILNELDEDYVSQLLRLEANSDGARDCEATTAEFFLTGMKQRHTMVRNWVASVENELCDAWPVHDRLHRARNPKVHNTTHQIKPKQDKDSPGNQSRSTTARMQERRLVLDTKDTSRLATMADRCILARVVTEVHLQRNDPKSAINFLLRYVLYTAPSLHLEDYPNLPPVQSLCIVETILSTPLTKHKSHPGGTKTATLDRTLLDYLLDTVLLFDHNQSLLECFDLSLAACAAIYRTRMKHEDTRISEPGLLENAAYQRLKRQFEKRLGKDRNASSWTAPSDTNDIENGTDAGESLSLYSEQCQALSESFLEEFTVHARMQTKDEMLQNFRNPASTTTLLAWMLPIVLTVHGDGSMLRSIFAEKSEIFVSSLNSPELLYVVEACSKAMRQLEIRNLDSYRAVVSSPTTTETTTVTRSMISHLVDSIISVSSGKSLATVSTLLSICHEYWSEFPMVHVINLERRKDRLSSFLSQAMVAGLWVLRGVIYPDQWEAMDYKDPQRHAPDLTSYIGSYAIDGSQDSPARVEQNLMDWLDLGGAAANGTSRYELDSLVLPRWRPNDLRPFDVYASDDPKLMVSVSPSEKACALSHIATWKGVASCYSPTNRALHAGYARGNPIHSKPEDNRIPPCPVSLILEDDAIMVDRFRDRLDELLRELPRDFHYCALGYAKPKEAPLVDLPGCEHIKLPTMTWYLTGYLLSQSGARYLLDHLPVEGPIDAWMGRKMILASNWENEYGHRIGVGDAPQKGSDVSRPTLTTKEIKACVQFRAYCASIPLCEQKVGKAMATNANANHHGTPNQNWRLRDSDIVYSGTIGKTNKRRTPKGKYKQVN